MISRYETGQVWTFKHRLGEDESRLTILRLDHHSKVGTIVHVRVDGVAIRNIAAPGGITDVISHMPFTEQAIDRSVREHVENRLLPDYSEAYSSWRQSFDDGEAGVFTLTVAEAIEYMERVVAGAPTVDD